MSDLAVRHSLATRPLGVLLDSGTKLVVAPKDAIASESPSSIVLGFSQPGLLFKNTHSHFLKLFL